MTILADRGRSRTIPAPAPAEGLRGRRLFWTWTAVVAAGEAFGFLFPAAAGVAAQSAALPAEITVILAAGALEGIFLGAAQQAVLRKALPELRGGRWVALTAGAAVAAYGLGFLVAFLAGVGNWVLVVPIMGTACLLLSTIGGAQAIELRHHVRRAESWITWTALAWLAGLGVFFAIATPLWHPGQSALAAVGVGVLGGAAMALVQAMVTGYGLLRLLATCPPTEEKEESR